VRAALEQFARLAGLTYVHRISAIHEYPGFAHAPSLELAIYDRGDRERALTAQMRHTSPPAPAIAITHGDTIAFGVPAGLLAHTPKTGQRGPADGRS